MFTSYMNGLKNNTFYYVRAYATNSYGTVYGNQVTFRTQGYSRNDEVAEDGMMAESSMLLYPNPVQSTLNVKLDMSASADVDISVYDLRGVRLYNLAKHHSSGTETIAIDVSTLPEGFYVLRTHTATEDLTEKFIKVR